MLCRSIPYGNWEANQPPNRPAQKLPRHAPPSNPAQQHPHSTCLKGEVHPALPPLHVQRRIGAEGRKEHTDPPHPPCRQGGEVLQMGAARLEARELHLKLLVTRPCDVRYVELEVEQLVCELLPPC